MNTNVLQFKPREVKKFEMPSDGDLISNLMTYTLSLKKTDPIRWASMCEERFGADWASTNWGNLPKSEVEQFARDWFNKPDLKVIQVSLVRHRSIKRENWEIFCFDPAGRIQRHAPKA